VPAGAVITAIIAHIETKNNGTGANAKVKVGTTETGESDIFFAEGEIDPYAEVGTRYEVPVWYYCPYDKDMLITCTKDNTATAGLINYLFRYTQS
jgi:hypothetical protein